MPPVIDRLQDFAGWLARGKVPLPEVLTIPPTHCKPPESVGTDIEQSKDYVTIDINELFLSHARFGAALYNPLVVVTTSFIYGGKRISVPAVVGPSLLAQSGQKLPLGTVIHDTTVAGPYPYRGDSVVISVVLYRVRQQDYLDGLLRMVEGISNAIGVSADITMLAKVGRTLLDGLQEVCGMGRAEPIAGHRIELSPIKPAGFRTSFSALIDNTTEVPTQRLRVIAGRLHLSNGDAITTPYDLTSFVLYSVKASDRRHDIDTLPFYSLYRSVLDDATKRSADAWASAKAKFAELWQQVTLSPDLTRAQAHELREVWRQELLAEHQATVNSPLLSMGAQAPAIVEERLAGIASILEM
jgi:hypothetical protein